MSAFWTALRKGMGEFRTTFNGRPEQRTITTPAKTATPLQRAQAIGQTPGYSIANYWEQLGHMSSWLFPAIDAICAQAENCSVEGYVKQKQVLKSHAGDAPAEQRTKVENHEVLELIDRPNPLMWRGSFSYLVFLHYCLQGGWVIWEVRDKETGKPCELWPLPKAWLTFVAGTAQYPMGLWRVTNPRGLANYWGASPIAGGFYLDVRETITGGRPHPLYPAEPYSQTQAMAQIIDIAEKTDSAVWNTLIEAPKPGMIFLVDGNFQMDDNQLRAYAEQVGQYKGGVNNAGKVMVVQGMSVEHMGSSLDDLQSVPLREQNQQMLQAVFSVPPIVTGIRTETGSYSGDAASINTWIELHIQPMLNRFAGCLNHRWHHYWPGFELEFSAKRFDDPTLDQKRSDQLFQGIDKGANTINEWRLSMKLSPMDGGDELTPMQQPSQITQNFHGGAGGDMSDQTGDMDLEVPGDETDDADMDLDLPDDESSGMKRPELSRAGGRPFSLNGNGRH